MASTINKAMSYMDLMSCLERGRERRGWNQSKMAEKVGISDATYSRWIKGAIKHLKNDDIDKLKRIAPYTGLPFSKVLTSAGISSDLEDEIFYDYNGRIIDYYAAVEKLYAVDAELFSYIDLISEFSMDEVNELKSYIRMMKRKKSEESDFTFDLICDNVESNISKFRNYEMYKNLLKMDVRPAIQGNDAIKIASYKRRGKAFDINKYLGESVWEVNASSSMKSDWTKRFSAIMDAVSDIKLTLNEVLESIKESMQVRKPASRAVELDIKPIDFNAGNYPISLKNTPPKALNGFVPASAGWVVASLDADQLDTDYEDAFAEELRNLLNTIHAISIQTLDGKQSKKFFLYGVAENGETKITEAEGEYKAAAIKVEEKLRQSH